MKKSLCLAGLLIGTSYAESIISTSDARNLKGITFCISASQMRVGNSLNDTVNRDFSTQQFEILKRKLTAYRIPYAVSCPSQNLWVNFTSASAGTAKSYDIDLIILTDAGQVQGYAGEIPIYVLAGGGITSNYSDTQLKEKISDEFEDLVDDFAADYATANP